MKIDYDSAHDVLYLKFGEGKRKVLTRQLTEDIAVDEDGKGRIVGLEILDASEHVDLASLLPVEKPRLKRAAG